MSHSKERAEKVCLNCGADVYGRYCHVCGQENLEPKESLWGLITHYAYDITHFDGKFFSTLRYLILRPGFLPAEYLRGKRASYLHPIRMYVFTSAFFFIIFFSLFHVDHINLNVRSKWISDSLQANKIHIRQQALKLAKTKSDTAEVLQMLDSLALNNYVHIADSFKARPRVSIMGGKYKTVQGYDSVQAALPERQRDGWMTRRVSHRTIAMYQKYNGDVNAIASAWLEKFMHSFPQLLFLSLPLFAFTLWLLYIRMNKQYYYTGHIIFTLYLYIFHFIAYLILFGVQKLDTATGWGIWNWVEAALWIYMLYYLYKAMRNFYRQRWFKTIVKLILLSIVSFFIILFLFTVFTIFSVYQI